VTWPTAVWPVVHAGAVPVLADVSPETLNITVESVHRALSPRTRVVFAVHTLGNPAPVDVLAGLCEERGLVLLEDVCESLDATLGERRVGSFGRMATFSFYVSHHITTIEGGMVLCRDTDDADRLRVLRAHGWTRQLPDGTRRAMEEAHPDIDPRFLFVEPGFNLRGTDVQAAIGRAQFARRSESVGRRRQTAAVWSAARDRHEDLFVPVRFESGASPFAFPLVLRTGGPPARRELIGFLEARGVETRPLVAGNLARQPAIARVAHRVAGPLPGADGLHERGLYVGLHPNLTAAQVEVLPSVLDEFAREVRR
jgi:CDP-6-deoxy-D-xylo-4-hexulose-3-dehydrase